MKVWITRQASDTVFMGGLREVLLWIDEPTFNHRCPVLEAELYDPATNTYVEEIYREEGWLSISGSLRAKDFLKQDEEINRRVWEEICNSLISWECPDPMEVNSVEELDSPLLRADYELHCSTPWKRFLLEIDLKNETVELVSPLVCYEDGVRARGLPLRKSVTVATSFLAGDLNRPYLASNKSLSHLELREDRVM
jgi:hypothetical protein